MTRLYSLTLCAALGLVACGSNTSSGVSGTGGSSVSGTGGSSVSGTGGSSVSGTGGSSSTKSALDIMPVDNTVSGWTIDREADKNANAAPMTGTTKAEVEAWIDGAATPFFLAPSTPQMFAWQNYLNPTLPAAQPDGASISMYVLQMPSVDQASGLYTSVLPLSEYSRKAGTPDDWKPTTPTLGDASRIEDDGSHWWINFRKGVFYVEIKLDPSTGPAPDYTPSDPDTKKEAVRFAQAVADRM